MPQNMHRAVVRLALLAFPQQQRRREGESGSELVDLSVSLAPLHWECLPLGVCKIWTKPRQSTVDNTMNGTSEERPLNDPSSNKSLSIARNLVLT